MTKAVEGADPRRRTSDAHVAPDKRATPEYTSTRLDAGIGISRRFLSRCSPRAMES